MVNELPAHADVVVVGGGVIGASVAYHLGQMGAGDVLLLERKKLTSGTTWHSVGQVRQLRSSRNLTEIIRYSTELYQRLEAETGQSTGWTRSGSLSIATNPDRLTHIRRQAGMARAHGVEVEEIGRQEIETLWPLLNTSDILAGIYCASDGRVNPSDLEGRRFAIDVGGRVCAARASLRPAFDADGCRLRGPYEPVAGAA